MAPTEVRGAAVDDAVVVADLNQHVHRLHAEVEPEDFYPTSPQEAEPFFEHLLADDDQVILIAEESGRPVGYVWAQDMQREPNPFTKPARTLYIQHIAVVPDSRRSGIGRALINAAQEHAANRGIERLALDHWAFNAVADQFCQGRLNSDPLAAAEN